MQELKDSNRQCVFQKVKAHMRETATAQPVSFTRGNQKADALAKACAQVETKRKLAELQPLIFRAVDVQTRLIWLPPWLLARTTQASIMTLILLAFMMRVEPDELL